MPRISNSKILITGIAVLLGGYGLSAAAVQGAPIPHAMLLALRWAGILFLCVFGVRKRSLTTWIIIAMVLGGEIGHDFPAFAVNLKLLGAIFLRLVKAIVAPLIISTLVVGIAGHSNLRQVGRMGLKALIYFEIVTTMALFIGLAAINISKAGVGVQMPPAMRGEQAPPTQKLTASDVILHSFPENIAKSIADGQVLQVVVFAALFGIALATTREAMKRPLLIFFDSMSAVMFKFTNIVMLFAPIGVGGAIAATVATMGIGVMVSLAKLLLTLYAALFVFILGVLLPVALLFRVPIRGFIRAVAEPASIAFATASSEAALPRAMEAMEAFGVPKQMVAFVIPTGYSFNLDGSTLYLALASVFVAQVAGIHMTFGQQLMMMFTLMLTSKGFAAVARASLVILMATADSFGLPKEPILMILGIDALMDMARTSVNLVGNCLASCVVARWEGEFRTEVPPPEVMEGVAQ